MAPTAFNKEVVDKFVEAKWDESVIDTICEYIRIPNQSPLFDKEWETNGFMDKAMDLLKVWAENQQVKGAVFELFKEPGRTPLLLITVDPTDSNCKDTILMYGHMDKQPPMADTWNPEFGSPWNPKIIGDKLYGRGGADDGYAIFSAISAIKALQEAGTPHARIVILIEACEESGSADLPYFIGKLVDKIGSPTLIICLDSGCGNYEQFWLTTSLRGVAIGTLKVDILTEGVHSGSSSGVVPSSFRIIRQLLSRIEDENTGVMKVPELFCEIPEVRVKQIQGHADALGDEIWQQFPFVEGAGPMGEDNAARLAFKAWKPTLSVTGVDGIPPLGSAGNVLRTNTSLKLSIRLPPCTEPNQAAEAIKKVLEKDPPYGAKVVFELDQSAPGWHAPVENPWLSAAIDGASNTFFGKPAGFMGEGGSIPFMGMLSEKFPQAQFVITGVLGPNSNAHGPNEFMHIPQSKNVTKAVAYIVAAHHDEFNKA
eukprot:Clim_evm4s197 gene=Clim_evmTU4s197